MRPPVVSIGVGIYNVGMNPADALRALVARHGEDLPLDRALLAVARDEFPKLDEARYRRRLDAWALRVADRVRAGASEPDAIREVLFEEVGLRGNEDAYYDPANSLLNEVLDRRLGIPITLSAVYIEVARRVGQRAEGVGFPGHFLVRHEWRGEALIVDPFNGGARLTRADCAQRLNSLSAGQAALEDWMLEASSGRALVARVLTNLKVAYVRAGDVLQAVRAIDRLLAVVPDRAEERRDRGILYAQIGLAGPAASDLEDYLAARPDADDQEALRARLPQLRFDASRMN